MNTPKTIWYIIIALVMGVIILLLQNWWIKDQLTRDRYKDLLNNGFLLVATFLGVFFAFYLTDLDSKNEKKERTINILTLSYKSLENYFNYTNGSYSGKRVDASCLKFWKRNSRHPDFIATSASEIFYTISPYTYSDLISMESGVNNMLRFIETSDTMSNELFRSEMATINCYLRFAGKHILWEIDYQEGHLNIDTLHLRINADHLNLNDSLRKDCYCVTFPIVDATSLSAQQTYESH